MAKQDENTKEAENILKLAKQKGINIVYVEEGERIKLDSNTYLEILFIGEDEVNLNNNSIIARLKYNNLTMLFTGDSEKTEEEGFMKKYENQSIKADILKVAHHGSSTSTTKGFIERVKPKIALIGVGKNNKFGHPNEEVLERLKDIRSKNL